MGSEDEDCAIYLKPSTELIPDEYSQNDNKSASVHVFIFKEHMEYKFVHCMQSLGYVISEKNVHILHNRKYALDALDNICKEIKDSSSLIILFWGLFRADRKFVLKDGSGITLIDIWSKFISSNCPQLKGKPRIFIFNGVKHLEHTEEDTVPMNKQYDNLFSYNIPAESDILIVFKQNDDLKASMEYMDSLCSNFQNYSYREDISSLLTIAHFSSHPTLISTMTRKFYLQPSSKRGMQLSLVEKYAKIEHAIEKVKENIILLTKDPKKLREEIPAEVMDAVESVDNLQRAASTEGILQARSFKPEALIRHRTRSNTTSRLIDIDKFLRKRSDSASSRPAWKY